jgi:dTMP kinase
MEGLFITLEGVDGAGKSSHLDWLAIWFRDKGRAVRMTREPAARLWGKNCARSSCTSPCMRRPRR